MNTKKLTSISALIGLLAALFAGLTGGEIASAATTWTFQAAAGSYYSAQTYESAMSADGTKVVIMMADISGNLRANLGTVAAGNPSSGSLTWATAGNALSTVTTGTSIAIKDVAMSADGTKAVAVWIKDGTLVESASATISSGQLVWGSITTVQTAGTTVLSLKSAFSSDATVANLVWTTQGGVVSSASAKISGSTQTWSTVSTIETNAQGNTNPMIAAATNGSVVTVAWNHAHNGSGYVQLNSASAAIDTSAATPVQTWSAVTSLTGTAQENVIGSDGNSLAASADGTKVVMGYSWANLAVSTANQAAYTQTATINPTTGAQTWSTRSSAHSELTKATANVVATVVRVAISADGSMATLAYFVRNQTTAAHLIGSRSATISANAATWSAQSDVANYASPVDTASNLKVFLSTDGTKAITSWVKTTGGNSYTSTATIGAGSNSATWETPVSIASGTFDVAPSADLSKALAWSGGQLSALMGSSITAPTSPTAVTASPGSAQASVSWTAPATGGTPASYTATSSPGGFTCTATAPAVTCNVSGLTNGTAYTFTVTSTNSAGTSAASTASAAVTPLASFATPGSPSGVTAVSGATSATVSWTAPATGGTPASYTVTSSPGGFTCTATAPAVSCNVTGLTNGTAYTFTVTATNGSGTSSASSASSAVTPAALVAPASPTAVSGSAGDTQAAVSWTAPSSGGAVATYTVTSSPGGFTCTATAPAVSCNVTGLTNGTAYTFTVTATNAAGTSSASAASAAVTPVAPVIAPPTTPTPTPTPTPTANITTPITPSTQVQPGDDLGISGSFPNGVNDVLFGKIRAASFRLNAAKTLVTAVVPQQISGVFAITIKDGLGNEIAAGTVTILASGQKLVSLNAVSLFNAGWGSINPTQYSKLVALVKKVPKGGVGLTVRCVGTAQKTHYSAADMLLAKQRAAATCQVFKVNLPKAKIITAVTVATDPSDLGRNATISITYRK